MNSKINEFRKTALQHWKENGRHNLPWRRTHDPYKILVSEIMLQQTQVDRVIPYYKDFLKKFPTVKNLAKSELSEVLKLWSGLGYNRRAKYLRDAARMVAEKYDGKFPKSYEELRELPGIGDYTARAVRVFAFNQLDILIETNVRTAIFHHFEKKWTSDVHISDKEIVPLALKAAEGQDPREWHWALMDCGAYLKRSGVRLNQKSAHYTKQSPFEGSLRQMRGKLLRRLMDGPITKSSFKKIDAKNAYHISMALQGMEREGLVVKEKGRWRIS
jgi:A/G-specific adenine glycosylase